MTAADHIPARTGPPRRPFAAVSIQVANITRWPRTLAGFTPSKGLDPNPFGLDPSLAGRNTRFWCFPVGAPRGGRFAMSANFMRTSGRARPSDRQSREGEFRVGPRPAIDASQSI